MLEGQIAIPRHRVKKSSGFALDIGGSLVKVVYFTGKSELSQDMDIEVSMASYRLTDVEAVLEKLKNLFGPELNRKVTFCGLGCMKEKDLINKYNIDFTTNSEMDCFVKAFYYLSKSVPPSSLLEPKPRAALEFTYQQYDEMISILEKVNPPAVPQEYPDRADRKLQPPAFPCLLAVLGSGGALVKIEEDGSYAIVEGHNRTGRTFVSLASLLVGTSDFEEILSLAERGTHKTVDGVAADYAGGAEDDLYAKTTPSEALFFAFGKALGKRLDDFRREDLARTLLVTHCGDLSQVIDLTARAHGVRHVYLAGSLVSHELVRYEMTRFLQLRILCNPQHGLSFEFLKNPGYYGALGALILDSTDVEFRNIDGVASTYTLQFLGVLAT